MGGGIDAARHATEYDEPAGRQVAGQALGHANAIGRRMPGSNHRNAGFVEDFGIALKVENQRRIVDLQQPSRDSADR